MSQLHGSLATLQFPAARAVTWLNGLGCRVILMPTSDALDCSWVISCSIHCVPVAYGRLNAIAWPDLIPAPHLAGSVQVVLPLGTTCQPWLVSRALAAEGSYGNGLPDLSDGDRYGVRGLLPTGPTVSVPYPRSGPLMMASWFIRFSSAARKYCCWMMGPLPVLDWKFTTE